MRCTLVYSVWCLLFVVHIGFVWLKMNQVKEIHFTPPEIRQAATSASENLLPQKSIKLYLNTYDAFKKWKMEKQTNSSSESVLLVYFTELAKKYKASSLWTYYSMLKNTLNIHENVNIDRYSKLVAFLKRQSEGFQAKKASTFTPENVNEFLTKAPDDKYLATKVALIMGIMGACRAKELYVMKVKDIEDWGGQMLINVPNTKTKRPRQFTVKDNLYDICKKYINCRTDGTNVLLFHQYRDGKITKQRIGMNSFSKYGKDIASFLKLPNPGNYSGHSFRRSSATILVDAGGDITNLKRHEGWKSTTVAEGYIDSSVQNKTDTANKISGAINYGGDVSEVTQSKTFTSGNTAWVDPVDRVQLTDELQDMDLSTNPFFTHGIDKLCTICHMILEDADSCYSIFSMLEEFESPVNVLQVLQTFSNINIYDEPKMVCATCYDKTIEVYKFIQLCNKAHENIQNYLKYAEEIRTRTDNEMNAIVKIEETDVSPTEIITVDGRNLEVENEKISEFDEFVISSTDIKIEERILQEGLKKEETTNNEEITISPTEIVTVKVENLRDEEIDAQIYDERMGLMCPECQEVFYNGKQLEIHMRGHHKKMFMCNDCGKVFTTKYTLKIHIRLHTGEKPYTCLICKRGYADPSSFRKHTDSHSGGKAHKCRQCDRQFTQAGNLRRHIMDTHNGVKAHKCLQCYRLFSRTSDLRRHMDIHNGVKAYKCEQCDRRFTLAATLRTHVDMHNGKKAHKCKQCGRRFTQLAHLLTHMNRHNGVKTHKCLECDRAHLTSLRRHMMMHSRELS